MIFNWLRHRRRQKLLTEPFAPDWLPYLHQNVPLYATLSEAEQARLRDLLRIFVVEKEWEGCGGFTITDEVRVTIAALACVLVVGLEDNCFERVQTVLVYPDAYVAPKNAAANGLLVEDSPRLGEAHYRGPVILTWAQIMAEAHRPDLGRNVVLHEFAHQLDMLNGLADGTPILADEQQYERWRIVMTREYHRLIQDAEAGRPTLLDDYGATDEAEFFAVVVECFFLQPRALRERHHQMYSVLRDYFGQDPAQRPEPLSPSLLLH
jgi:Mlc titration factor MtfA (ptsG expression regulator)